MGIPEVCVSLQALYEKELLLSPLVREGMSLGDLKDFVDAIEKVLNNVDQLRGQSLNEGTTAPYDAIRAIDENVK